MTAQPMPAEPTPKVERFGCSPDGYGGRHGEQCVWAYDYDILLAQLTAALAEIERLRALNNQHYTELCQTTVREQAALARAESAEKDARRYRWLRNESATHRVSSPSATMQDGHGVKVIWQSYGMDDRTKPRCVLFDAALDAAIDAMVKP